jgi:small-conductance mechanosensitive channel
MAQNYRTLKLKVNLSIGYVNASREDVIDVEVPINAPPDELERLISDAANDWAGNYIDVGYQEVE